MKSYLLKILGILLMVAAFAVAGGETTKACDRTEITLDSLIIGSRVEIQITVMFGGGLTGTSTGAGASTRTFAFAFFGSPTLANVSFLPSLTSDSTMATYNGTDAGPAFGARYAIAYIYSGIDFACISSTAACGNRHTDTMLTRFTMNELPDSLRLVGFEGAGNPFAGCYPDADMLINFTILPVVWAGFEAHVEPYGVDLEWTTSVETNNDHFLVQRSVDGNSYVTLSEIEAAGNSARMSGYNFTDPQPLPGSNFYRIVQVDVDGKRSNSTVQQIEYTAPSGMHWTQIGPNPATDRLSLGFYTENNQEIDVRLIDLQGRIVLQKHTASNHGTNQLDLDLSTLANGYYSLQLNGPSGMLEQKIIKM